MKLRSLLTAMALAAAVSLLVQGSARADLVYETDVTVVKRELVRVENVDPSDMNPEQDNFGIKKDDPSREYSQRVIIKGDLMKIRNSSGLSFIFDLGAKTVVRIDRNSGNYWRMTLDDFAKTRALSLESIQKKKASNAKSLLMDIQSTIDNAKTPAEKEKLKKAFADTIKRLEQLRAGVYEYKTEELKGRNPYFIKGVFTGFRNYRAYENETRFLHFLTSGDVDGASNRFFAAMGLFPAQIASEIAAHKELLAYCKFNYDFPDYTAVTRIRVLGWCEATLPAELFKIPAGFQEKNEPFETILEGL
ncbi:MAG: hypothetical protein WC712_09100 [Candidatus Brocadiia bacterium]